MVNHSFYTPNSSYERYAPFTIENVGLQKEALKNALYIKEIYNKIFLPKHKGFINSNPNGLGEIDCSFLSAAITDLLNSSVFEYNINSTRYFGNVSGYSNWINQTVSNGDLFGYIKDDLDNTYYAGINTLNGVGYLATFPSSLKEPFMFEFSADNSLVKRIILNNTESGISLRTSWDCYKNGNIAYQPLPTYYHYDGVSI